MRNVVFVAFLMILVSCAGDPSGSNAACSQPMTLSIGTPVNGELTSSDCTAEGTREDNYHFQVSAHTVLLVNLTGSANELGLVNEANTAEDVFDVATGQTYVALPPGGYTLQVMGNSGSYTLSVTSTSAPTACANFPVYLTHGSVVSGSISSTSCVNNSYYGNGYRWLARANQMYTFSSTATMGLNLEANQQGTPFAFNVNNNAGSNSLTLKAPVSNNLNLSVVAVPQNKFGTYTLTMQ